MYSGSVRWGFAPSRRQARSVRHASSPSTLSPSVSRWPRVRRTGGPPDRGGPEGCGSRGQRRTRCRPDDRRGRRPARPRERDPPDARSRSRPVRRRLRGASRRSHGLLWLKAITLRGGHANVIGHVDAVLALMQSGQLDPRRSSRTTCPSTGSRGLRALRRARSAQDRPDAVGPTPTRACASTRGGARRGYRVTNWIKPIDFMRIVLACRKPCWPATPRSARIPHIKHPTRRQKCSYDSHPATGSWRCSADCSPRSRWLPRRPLTPRLVSSRPRSRSSARTAPSSATAVTASSSPPPATPPNYADGPEIL